MPLNWGICLFGDNMLVLPDLKPETLVALAIFVLMFCIACWYEEHMEKKNKKIAEESKKKFNKNKGVDECNE
ncbi:hypothetical protein [Acinetobacter phage vB_AbaS_TCUP2199]|nr:hypothetical protein [Acinetobacter phage vB_AbaS_TCUP2199]